MTEHMCITGVSGFIGRHVAKEALRRGYRVTGVDRTPSHIEGIEFIQADIRDKARITDALKGQRYVIHLAAITSDVEFLKSFGDCYDINTNGFLNVIATAVENGCQGIVYASSAAVYVDSFSEETPIDFRKHRNHYAKTKIMNEMVAQSYEDIYNIRTTALRYFNVYGDGENTKGDYASIVSLFLAAKRSGGPLVIYGDGKQARDLIHVTDAARVTLDLLEKRSYQLYNVGTGVATAYETIATMIDERSMKYVPNPLPSYQYYTKAETTRLREVVEDYRFIQLEKAIEELRG